MTRMDLLFEAVQTGNARASRNDDVVADPTVCLPVLPITNKYDLEQLNVRLSDTKVFDQLALKLKGFDKSGTQKVRVRSILEALLEPQLVVKYSWSGKNALNDADVKKFPFCELRSVFSVLAKVIQMHSKSPINEKELIVSVRDFFKRAKFRMK